MISEGSFCLRKVHGEASFIHGHTCRFTHMKSYNRRPDATFVTMGPVVASIAMYATHRMLTRLLAGQILRKGVQRKIRRLGSMFMDYHVLSDVFNELIEEFFTFLLNPWQ